MTARIVNLEVNDGGKARAWRLVTSFDLDRLGEDCDIEYYAHQLLAMSNNPKLKARLIVPGSVPLMTWERYDTWREWEGVA
jgi:hypothetical protein